MRKLFIHIAALALIASCNKVESPVPSTDPSDIVYATIEYAADTKTSLDGEKIVWSSGDEIVVFKGKTLPLKYIVSASSVGTTEGYFKKDADYELLGPSSEISHNVAFYPFAELSCKAEGQNYTLENITLPSVQTYAPASFGPNSFPMMAVSADTDDAAFRFKNLCGALKLQLQGEGIIKSITIKGNSDEILAGSASVKMSRGGTPALSLASDGAKEVTLDCGEGVSLNADTPTSFLLALPPTAFSKGFTVTVTDTFGGVEEFSTTKKNTISRSSILRMPVKEYIGIMPEQGSEYIDEYGINRGQGIVIDGIIWAPVNCGYHETDFKYGKLYQWGRKYGQGYDGDLYDSKNKVIGTYTDVVVPLIQAGPVEFSVGQSKISQNRYYTKRTSPYDWHNSSITNLWNSGTETLPKRTEYDPCPRGWRVPTFQELLSLAENYSSGTTDDKGQFGRWLCGSASYAENVAGVFLSAAGERDCETGIADGRGYSGIYWSSKRGQYIMVGGPLGHGGTIANANAFSIRCVKDDADFISVESVVMNTSSHSMRVGGTFTLSAIIYPSDATSKDVQWLSDDENIATVDEYGKITAISVGTTTITAVAGEQVAKCIVSISSAQNGDYIDEYNINHGQGIEIDGVVWAPVNCGYHSDDFRYGKLYQWGRKYGQGYGGGLYDMSNHYLFQYYDEVLPTIMEGPVTLSAGQSISYQNVFLINMEVPYDWLSPQNDDIWNDGTEDNPVKSEYDPCPIGWRVPTYAELEALQKNHSSWANNDLGHGGYWFTGSNVYSSVVEQVFLAAAGSRQYYYGSAVDRGYYGTYWSSTPNGKNASYLNFYSKTAEMRNSIRASSKSVRCVQATDEVAEL